MIAQLRTYTINAGMMESWLKAFDEEIIPCVKEAVLYGSEWSAQNVDRLRAHQVHREIVTIEPFLPDRA